MENKSSALFMKKPICKGDLLPAWKIFIERPDIMKYITVKVKHNAEQIDIFFLFQISILYTILVIVRWVKTYTYYETYLN